VINGTCGTCGKKSKLFKGDTRVYFMEGFNMETTKTVGETTKKDRVVLALSTEQAKELKHFCDLDGVAHGSKFEHYNLALTISNRIGKTLNNQEAKTLGYPRGTKQMQEEGALK
jgi:hypothetical protein